MLKTAWERDDSEFMFVDATVRHWLPSSMSWEMVSKSLTASLVRPCYGENEGSKRERRRGSADRSEAGSYRKARACPGETGLRALKRGLRTNGSLPCLG
jgi:hypothetical protein